MLGIEPAGAVWPGPFFTPSFPGPPLHSVLTATQGPGRMALRAAKKQTAPYRREPSSARQTCPSDVWRIRQVNVMVPICQRRPRAARVSNPVTQWPSWGLNWGCLAPEPVPLTHAVYLLISSGAPEIIPRPTGSLQEHQALLSAQQSIQTGPT